jgi:ketosteroid isomerase-like protein
VKGRQLVLVVFVALVALLAYFYFHPSEEKKIKKQLALLSEDASKDRGESAFALARRLDHMGALFADRVDLKVPAYELSGTHTRREIVHLAARAGMAFSQLTLKFHDVSVAISGEGMAKVSATGRLKGIAAKGESADEVQDLELTFRKGGEGRWLITAVEVIEVLKK